MEKDKGGSCHRLIYLLRCGREGVCAGDGLCLMVFALVSAGSKEKVPPSLPHTPIMSPDRRRLNIGSKQW